MLVASERNRGYQSSTSRISAEMLHLWKARTRNWDIDSIIKLEKLYVCNVSKSGS